MAAEKKMKDPVRYPKVINGYENLAKKNYSITLNKMTADLVKVMVEQVKK
jgi:hypothetical protein